MGGEENARDDGAQALAGRFDSGVARSLSHVLRNTGVSVTYDDPDLNVLWAQNLPPGWVKENHELLVTAKTAALNSCQPQRLEVVLPEPDGDRWFDVWVDLDRSADGRTRGIVTTLVDITDQKRREQTLKVLLREVSHRSKNLLAIIQSIASQTGRYSETIEGFLDRFRGRIQSLASSQDLVTSSNWRGADLYDLLIGQVSKYTADPLRAIRFEGKRPYLNPNAALHIGLALHELAVNSVSYGALSRPGGTVTVAVSIQRDNGSESLLLTWTERIFSTGSHEPEKRFGSIALERVVPSSLGGSAELAIDDDRLRYSLRVPAGSFELD